MSDSVDTKAFHAFSYGLFLLASQTDGRDNALHREHCHPGSIKASAGKRRMYQGLMHAKRQSPLQIGSASRCSTNPRRLSILSISA